MYFITICTHNRECLFGEIVGAHSHGAYSHGAYSHGAYNHGAYSHTPLPQSIMQLNAYGEIVRDEWLKTPSIRTYVILGEWVIMPNHIHVILIITHAGRGVWPYAPTNTVAGFRSPSHTVGAIVRGFKSAVTKQINIQRGTPGQPVWQRNYWEHIIRDEHSYVNIANYIHNNPATWQADKLYAVP